MNPAPPAIARNWVTNPWTGVVAIPLAIAGLGYALTAVWNAALLATIICVGTALAIGITVWIRLAARRGAEYQRHLIALNDSRKPDLRYQADGLVTAVSAKTADIDQLDTITTWNDIQSNNAWRQDLMSLLINKVQPRRVGLLASSAATIRAETLKKILALNGITAVIVKLDSGSETDAAHLQAKSEELIDAVSTTANPGPVVDITAGTALMSVALHNAAVNRQCQLSYVDAVRHDGFIDTTTSQLIFYGDTPAHA